MNVNPESVDQPNEEPVTTPVSEQSPWTRYCENCRSPEAEKGYVTPLCVACRKAFSRYPIHKHIKGAAILVGIIIVYSLWLVPERLQTYFNYERAKKLMTEHRFHSARALLEPLMEQYNDNMKLRVAYMEAAFRDGDYDAADSIHDLIANSSFEDENVLADVDRIISEKGFLYIHDDCVKLLEANTDNAKMELHLLDSMVKVHPDAVGLKTTQAYYYNYVGNIETCDSIFLQLLKEYPGSVDIRRKYAERLDEREKYQAADSLFSLILQSYPEDQEALTYVQANYARKSNAYVDSITSQH
ncbi:lipopolysaccharide assembly protein LapB [Chitinophaga sp. Cy-1792]|uniref:tetratricopeptide repeat protein n=1 Tax=Chitinophaga sp. Cy-1792 TaxID=2608339 RepID=UPI0014221C93|nr:tetratricopeptide repeat protein [Chitinophaga sp. Cy-1792]NIG52566.1 tetratricopeptide repeat protein [Chitinophaga sp. Cy-1792]